MRRARVRVVPFHDGANAPTRTTSPALDIVDSSPSRRRSTRGVAGILASLLVAVPLLLPVAGVAAAPRSLSDHEHLHDADHTGGIANGTETGSRSSWSMSASTDATWTLRYPVAGTSRISQYYRYGSHYAIDIAAASGTPVVAGRSGRVTFSGWKNNGGGYQVWISHGSGRYTTYNHMRSTAVRRGQSVTRGQRVGRVGSTGNSTGPHLHFEVWFGPIWDGGRRVNPMNYISR